MIVGTDEMNGSFLDRDKHRRHLINVVNGDLETFFQSCKLWPVDKSLVILGRISMLKGLYMSMYTPHVIAA